MNLKLLYTFKYVNMSRCPAFTKNGKKCRSKRLLINNLFCCTDHIPLNKEIIENGCFMCMEIIKAPKDLIYFKCKHTFHKECYIEWLQYSTYEEPICMICRNVVFKKSIKIDKKYNIKELETENIEKLTEINEILSYNSNYYINTLNNNILNINNNFIPMSPPYTPPMSQTHTPSISPTHTPPMSPTHTPSTSPNMSKLSN